MDLTIFGQQKKICVRFFLLLRKCKGVVREMKKGGKRKPGAADVVNFEPRPVDELLSADTKTLTPAEVKKLQDFARRTHKFVKDEFALEEQAGFCEQCCFWYKFRLTETCDVCDRTLCFDCDPEPTNCDVCFVKVCRFCQQKGHPVKPCVSGDKCFNASLVCTDCRKKGGCEHAFCQRCEEEDGMRCPVCREDQRRACIAILVVRKDPTLRAMIPKEIALVISQLIWQATWQTNNKTKKEKKRK